MSNIEKGYVFLMLFLVGLLSYIIGAVTITIFVAANNNAVIAYVGALLVALIAVVFWYIITKKLDC